MDSQWASEHVISEARVFPLLVSLVKGSAEKENTFICLQK